MSLQLPEDRSLPAINSELLPQGYAPIAALPELLITLLERRYLDNLDTSVWQIGPVAGDVAFPIFQPITQLGRPLQPREWSEAMPHVLAACHDPGHALLLALHGSAGHHQLYLGGRRLVGHGAGSTEDYIGIQTSAFKAYYTGIEFGSPAVFSAQSMPALANFIQTAPVVSVIAGVPRTLHDSLVDGFSMDRLVRAIGNQDFALMVAAEPIAATQVDGLLDTCRKLRSEIHTYVRRTLSRGKSEGESDSYTESQGVEHWSSQLPVYLQASATFLQGALMNVAHHDPRARMMLALVGAMNAGSLLLRNTGMNLSERTTRHIQTNQGRTENASLELLNATAAACEQLLQQQEERMILGRGGGWWRTAIYIATATEAAHQGVLGALRSIGGITGMHEPLRHLQLPTHFVRSAMMKGQILQLRPNEGGGHPFGESYDIVGACMNSGELASFVNLPKQEISGVPMRDRSLFAVALPPRQQQEATIRLGSLQDGLGRNLGPIDLTALELNRHGFVTGATGYGKTNTCARILLESYSQLGIPFLVIEPVKSEYRRLAHAAQLHGKLRVYAINDPTALPLRINPFTPMPGIPLSRHIDLLKAVFNASFSMFAGMTYVLEEAFMDIYSMRGWNIQSGTNPFLSSQSGLDARSALTPCLSDLHDQIEVVLQRKRYGEDIHLNMGAALRSRLKSLSFGGKGYALNTRRGVPPEDIFNGPTIIELENLGDDDEKAFVMAILLVFLYEYAQVRQQRLPIQRRNTLQHLTLVEEAHRLLGARSQVTNPEVGDPAGKAVGMFTNMLAEMRAYGEGFLIADQTPTKVAPEVLKNSSLKIVHRLPSADDRQIMGAGLNLREPQLRHLNNLSPGETVIHNERIGEAVLTQITPVDDLAPSEHVDLGIKKAPSFSEKVYLFRHAGCRACPAPCTFYADIEKALSEGNSQEGKKQTGGTVDLLPLDSCLDALLLGDVTQAWSLWQQWCEEWISEFTWHLGPNNHTRGHIFCAAIHSVHAWLERMLRQRTRPRKGVQSLSPQDRIVCEQAARALSPIILAWTDAVAFDDEVRRHCDEAVRALQTTIGAAPARELPGCKSCPIRCRALFYVAPHLIQMTKVISPKLPMAQGSVSTRLVTIEQLAKNKLPILGVPTTSEETRRGILYCLIANVAAEPSAQTLPDDVESLLTELR